MMYKNEEYYTIDECIELITWRASEHPKRGFCTYLSKYTKPIKINNISYFKKSDIDHYIKIEKNTIPVKDLLKETGYKSVDGLCMFLEKCNIEIFKKGTIPFDVVKRVSRKDISTILRFVKNKDLLVSKKYPKYMGEEDVYDLDECRYLFTWVDNDGFNKKDKELIRFVSRNSRFVTQDGFTYFIKEDIDKIVEEQSQLIPLSEIIDKSPYSSIQALGKYLKNEGFNIVSPKNIPYYPHRSFLKKDKDTILALLSKFDFDIDKYYSKSEALELFKLNGRPIGRQTLNRYVEGKEFLNTIYYLKEDIDKLIELNNKTVIIATVFKELGFNKADSMKKFLIRYNIPYIDKKDHPFGNGTLVYKHDLDAIKRMKKLNEEYIIAGKHSRYEVLKKMSNLDVQKAIESSIKDLDHFIEDSISSSDSDSTTSKLALAGSRIHRFMNLNLPTDIKKMSTKEFASYLTLFENNPNHSINDLMVFVNFYNHLLEKYDLTNSENYNAIDYNKNDLYNQDSIDTSPYTREQFLELCYTLYNNIYDISFFNKIKESRFLANAWLYMALHFVVAWRRQDILEIASPDLRVIGFESADDFLNFLTEPSKFTEDMGFAICSNVKMLVEGIGTSTNKTGEDLVIEIGRVFSRPLGMMLALCEAFKQKSGEELLISGYSSRKKIQVELLGEDYERIFGSETFSNRRANKSYENYLISQTEDEGSGMGYFIGALARSHKLNENLIPISTQKYVNREVDKDVSAAAIELWNSGSFGFVKYELLSMIDEEFDNKRLSEKRKAVKDIQLSPLSINDIVKSVSNQKNVSRQILKTLSQDEVTFKETVKNLTSAVSSSKSNYAKCLLRAIPLEKILGYNADKNFSNESSISKSADRCLYPNVTNCDGCPMLVAQIYYLFELKDKINKLLDDLENSTNDFDIQLYNQIFNEGYSPILEQIADEIGTKSVNSIIQLGNIQERVLKLEKKNKLILN